MNNQKQLETKNKSTNLASNPPGGPPVPAEFSLLRTGAAERWISLDESVKIADVPSDIVVSPGVPHQNVIQGILRGDGAITSPDTGEVQRYYVIELTRPCACEFKDESNQRCAEIAGIGQIVNLGSKHSIEADLDKVLDITERGGELEVYLVAEKRKHGHGKKTMWHFLYAVRPIRSPAQPIQQGNA